MTSTELLTAKEAASILKIATGTLANWRVSAPGLLPFVKIGRMVRYRRGDVERLSHGTRQLGANGR